MYVGEKPRKGLSKFVAVLTALAIASASLLALPVAAQASPYNVVDELAEKLTQTLADGIAPLSVAESRIADPDTRGEYTMALESNDSTRYDGRVWTDKTVTAGPLSFSGDAGDQTIQLSKDGEFLVTYSALATSTSITGRAQVPVDVVFVIDNSNSMDENLRDEEGWWDESPTRLEATIDAVNQSIATIMESNPESRVGVVLYGMGSEVLLPLGHYSPMQNGNYVSVSSRYIDGGWYGTSGYQTTFTAPGNRSVTMGPSDRGTNAHLGVDAGMDLLSNASDIGEEASKHVPALILLSDGANTAAGSGNWWNPSSNEHDGDGTETANSYALKVAMNAQYNKQLVNQHYDVTDASSPYACKIYTIGMGIEQLRETGWNADNTDYYRAQLALDPGAHLNDNNNQAEAIRNAWNQYNRDWNNTPTLDRYTFQHPQSNDISTIAYNDAYYAAENANDVVNVFDEITAGITTSAPTYPTQVSGDNPVEDGWLNYSDTIGEYMQVNNVPAILYGGQYISFTGEPSVDGNVTTYSFSQAINSPVYGALNASDIDIRVTTNGDGTQTITVDVPAAAIPLRVNTVDLDTDGNVVSNKNNNALPLRVIYEVGMKDGTVDENGNLIVGDGGVSQDYVTSHTEGDAVAFYSNAYTGQQVNGSTVGDAKTTFTPATTNPFYYVQGDQTLYTDQQCMEPAAAMEQTGGPWGGGWQEVEFDTNATYYYQVEYYVGNQIRHETVALSGSQIANFVHRVGENADSVWTLNSGVPRFDHLTDLAQPKTQNNTGTAEQRLQTHVDGTLVTQYVGNNGKLTMTKPATLTVQKAVEADDGLTAPDATFSFTITAQAKAGQTINAVKTEGGEATTETVELVFDDAGSATFTLADGEGIAIPGMSGVECTIIETNNPGGFKLNSISEYVPDGETAVFDRDLSNASVTGTVAYDTRVVFTNKYAVTPIDKTPTDLGLTLTKTILNRDFEQGDSFSSPCVQAKGRLRLRCPTTRLSR